MTCVEGAEIYVKQTTPFSAKESPFTRKVVTCPVDYFMLLETGDVMLLETGDKITLE
jgi:hypothetical protein